MGTKFSGRLVAMFWLVVAITSVSGWAATDKIAGANPPSTTQPGTSDRIGPNRTGQPTARPLNPRMKTPFDRVLAPMLTQILKTAGAAKESTKAQPRQFDATGAANGGNPNFPTFVAAPFLTLNANTSGDPTSLFATVTGDFNNDGKPDIAAVQTGGTISVILNPGSMQDIANITPLPPNTSLDSQTPNVASVVAIDMNGDGNLDLVGQDLGNGQIVVWMGKGDGTFGNAVTYPVAPQSGTSWVYGGFMLVGDFNNDGKPDVVALTMGLNFSTPVSSPVTLQTFLNTGDGKLKVPTTENDVLFKDFYYSNPQQAAIVRNDGSSISGIAFLIMDDGINHPGNQGASVLYISSKGDGTFSSPIEPTAPAVVDPQDMADSSFFATNLKVSVPTSAKKSGNGAASASAGTPVTDIVFLTGDGAVYDAPYQPGSGSFTLPPPSILVGANTNPCQNCNSAPAAKELPIPNTGLLNLADMNNDGSLDLLVYTLGSTLIFPGTGSGTFGTPTQVVGGLGGDQQPEPADFDGGGYNSFVWADSYLNRIGYYQNFGASNAANAGQFYAAPPVSGASTNGGASYDAWGGNIQVQAAGDFNRDGLQDVIAYDFSHAAANGNIPDLVVGLNNGHSNNANQVNNFTFSTAISAAGLHNLNVAYVEPVTIASSTGISILLATGNGLVTLTANPSGSFGPPVSLNLGISLDCPLNYADVGDINGDGALDIVVAYGGDASCSGLGSTPSGYFTLLGNGGGAFQPATFTPLGGALYMVKLINFGGAPGNLDLAADDLDSIDGFFGVYTLPNKADGSGTFDGGSLSENALGYVVSDIIPGDFNNDGKQDLTLTTEGQYVPGSYKPAPDTTGVLLLPSLGTQGFFNFGTPALVDSGFYALWGSYADFNGDGYPDLAVATVESTAGFNNPFAQPPAVPLVQILPNQKGYFGPVLTELDSAEDVQSAYTFTGNFGNTGGNDLLVTGDVNTAEFLNQGANKLTLTSSIPNPSQGTPVTLTATLSQTIASSAASGSVSFSANGSVLGAAPMSANTAAFTTTALPLGTNTVTASYSGDQLHNASAASVTVNIAPPVVIAPTFSLTASANSLALQQGATGAVTLNLAANGTFAGPISFTCSGEPSAASCSVNPASLTLAGNQTGNVSVIVATTPKNNQYQASNSPWMKVTGGLSLAGLLCFMVPRRRRVYSTLGAVAFLLLSLGSISMLSGCGGADNKFPGTPVGNSTITVTATSGSITQTQMIALTVTQAQQ